jgi:hypothetical protein
MTSDSIILLAVLLSALAIYLLPTIIAALKGHKYFWVILFINIVFGFTLIGWVGSLIWSIAGDKLVDN